MDNRNMDFGCWRELGGSACCSLPEDRDLLPFGGSQHLELQAQEIQYPLLAFPGTRPTQYTDRHVSKAPVHIKTNKIDEITKQQQQHYQSLLASPGIHHKYQLSSRGISGGLSCHMAICAHELICD